MTYAYIICINTPVCMHVKIMVKVVKRQPADHSTKGTVSAVLTTYHVSYAHA